MAGEQATTSGGSRARGSDVASTTRVVVVADTHAPRHWKRMPEPLAWALGDADHVLHAGDVCDPVVLDQLREFAPVTVVQGNNDTPAVRRWGARDRVELHLGGVRVGMLHDSGSKQGRAQRMHCLFPDADLVVFGHSHIPWHTREEIDGHAFHLLNPGSVTDPRRQPLGSFVRLELGAGRLQQVEFIPVARRAGQLPEPPANRTR